MGYSVVFKDITRADTDVILNSLGVQGNRYGSLCKHIISAMKSNDIKNYIDSLKNNEIGDIFITNSGSLHCEKVFHVVTPFKENDDIFNSKLKKAYTDAINKAIELGYNSIALPMIGIRNGYSEKEVYDVLEKVCGKISVEEAISNEEILDIKIYILLKEKAIPAGNNRNLYYKYNNPNELAKVSNELLNNILKCHNAMNRLDVTKLVTPQLDAYYFNYDFVIDYFYSIGKKDDKFLNEKGMNYKRKSKLKERKYLKKEEIYAIAYMAEMNFSNLVQFMIICGYSFQPNKLDLFIIDNYEKNLKDNINTIMFSAKCFECTGINICDSIC